MTGYCENKKKLGQQPVITLNNNPMIFIDVFVDNFLKTNTALVKNQYLKKNI